MHNVSSLDHAKTQSTHGRLYFFGSSGSDRGLPIERVHLSVIGEPLLHPKIFDRICRISLLGFKTRIFTNASLMDKTKGLKLIESGLTEISISLNGFNTDSHQRMMGFMTPYYERCISNILDFTELNQGRVRMKMSCLLEPLPDANKIDGFLRFWEAKGIECYVGVPVPWHRQTSEEVRLGPIYPCPYIFSELVVSCQGNVIGCCRDYRAQVILGSVMVESLTQIWNGEKMKRFRREHFRGNANKIPLCSHCETPLNIDFFEIIRFLKKRPKTAGLETQYKK